MIRDVHAKKLAIHDDDRGALMEELRADAPSPGRPRRRRSSAHPGVIEVFQRHEGQSGTWFFAAGMVQVVLFDMRRDSPTVRQTDVLCTGSRDRLVVSIPKYVAHGYRALVNEPAVLFYHATATYDPNVPDEERLPFDSPEIGCDWKSRFR